MRIGSVLSVWFCFVASLASGQQTSVAPAEIFYNGKIVTVDFAFRIQEAFAVHGEQFFAIGGNAAVKAMAGPQTRLIDLGGHTVIPGLMDNHTHQYPAALDAYRGLNLVGVPSLAEMLNRLRQAVAKAKPGETVVTTGGWSERDFPEKRPPTRADLDQVSSDHPIIVFRGRGTAYFNSAALKAAGITRETQTIAGNPLPKDSAGEPTGVFGSPASLNAATRTMVPPPAEPELKEMLRKVQERLHPMGFTSVREVELRPEAMRAYQSLWREGKLTLRVSMGLGVNSTEADEMERILSPWGVGPGFGDHRLRLDGIGEFGMDVTDNAHLREPYANRPGNRGAMRITPEQLRQAMLTINRNGWRPAVHIMGDATLDAVLGAFEAANAESSIRDKRWIVEHIPLVHSDQMERLARLGVLVSAQVQPYNGAEGMIRNFGKERADRAVPLRELLDHHLIVSTGSDWAGEGDDNPFVNLYFYVTRKTRTGTLLGASQKISREEALRVATINNAHMTFEEEVKGSIEPGKLADFVILSQDILTVPEEQIPFVRPLATYVGGRKVFASKDGGF